MNRKRLPWGAVNSVGLVVVLASPDACDGHREVLYGFVKISLTKGTVILRNFALDSTQAVDSSRLFYFTRTDRDRVSLRRLCLSARLSHSSTYTSANTQ